uniref:G-protein coupled receptors family 1 profile domain-containing protein n=1 Tax=Cyprinus carpio TaxID=7962 RepID=A0A8C1ZVI3_CYPCA
MANENYSVKNVDSFIITGFDHLQNQKLLGFLILITYMLILLGNGINLCIISTDKHLRKPMYMLICNLAVVDIMFSSTFCCPSAPTTSVIDSVKTFVHWDLKHVSAQIIMDH